MIFIHVHLDSTRLDIDPYVIVKPVEFLFESQILTTLCFGHYCISTLADACLLYTVIILLKNNVNIIKSTTFQENHIFLPNIR